MRVLIFGMVCLFAVNCASADERPNPQSVPRPVPLTRPEMKRLLEEMKERAPRIPLPELTEADREKLGERADSYETCLRYHYLPGGKSQANGPSLGGFGGFGFSRDPDPKMSLEYSFKTEMFWIVSRTNNCQYCLGHQESKLLSAGLSEDQIASLDGDWAEFKPSEQAAFAFARKLTYEPHHIGDADIDALRKHFTDLQILEMVLSVSGNNAINRWKEGAGIPQSRNGGGFGSRRDATGNAAAASTEHQTYLTPTSERFRESITKVAPVITDPQTGKPSRDSVFRRESCESRELAEKALAQSGQRKPRLPMVSDAEASELLGADRPEGKLPEWIRLLANFPRDGKIRILSQRAAEESGDLTKLAKAQISWIVARQDRAWYAAGRAKKRLQSLGWTDDQIFALDGDWSGYSPQDRAMFVLAQKLAATPVVLTDEDVAEAVRQLGPRDVTQLISYTTTCASFDRITEAAGLAVDP